MHPADIICELSKKGRTQSSIAEDLDCSPSLITGVIYGDKTSYNVASQISAITGKPLNTLWPDKRYARAPKDVAAA